MMYVTTPSGCKRRRTASASMPIPIRSSERNISSACCLVRDILRTLEEVFYLLACIGGEFRQLVCFAILGRTVSFDFLASARAYIESGQQCRPLALCQSTL